MRKHILIVVLALMVAAIGVFSLAVLYSAGAPPNQPAPQVYCALPQPQSSEYQCTVNQTIPGYHPQGGAPDAPAVFLPMYPGSSICRAYYVDGLTNGTVTFCPVQDLDRHD